VSMFKVTETVQLQWEKFINDAAVISGRHVSHHRIELDQYLCQLQCSCTRRNAVSLPSFEHCKSQAHSSINKTWRHRPITFVQQYSKHTSCHISSLSSTSMVTTLFTILQKEKKSISNNFSGQTTIIFILGYAEYKNNQVNVTLF